MPSPTTSMNGLENKAGGTFSASSRPLCRNAASGTARAVADVRASIATRRHFSADAVTCNSSAVAVSRAISAACPSSDQSPNRARLFRLPLLEARHVMEDGALTGRSRLHAVAITVKPNQRGG